MHTHTLEEVQDKLIGEIGTPNRDKFEYELQIYLIGKQLNILINEVLTKESFQSEPSFKNMLTGTLIVPPPKKK
jgi:hypothetical protein